MAELKTKPNQQSVTDFLNAIESEQKRNDSFELLDLMKSITNCEPKMWGDSIIGFGSYHYVYDSGREGDWFLTGFSPRKRNFSLYIMAGFTRYQELLNQLGKHKTGKSCLYINKLEDIDLNILQELIEESVKYMRDKYETST
jgi:hypothetical protein